MDGCAVISSGPANEFEAFRTGALTIVRHCRNEINMIVADGYEHSFSVVRYSCFHP